LEFQWNVLIALEFNVVAGYHCTCGRDQGQSNLCSKHSLKTRRDEREKQGIMLQKIKELKEINK
jgi:hypothetical protein